MLSRILHGDIKSAEQARLPSICKEAQTDSLTGLYNRRGWDQLDSEEERCAIYGYPASIIVIDIDDLKTVDDRRVHAAGDQLLQRAGQLLQQITRKQDPVARMGGDEFVMLCVECSLVEGELIKHHLENALGESQLYASGGIAGRYPSQGLRWAWANADRAMYSRKQANRQKTVNRMIKSDHRQL